MHAPRRLKRERHAGIRTRGGGRELLINLLKFFLAAILAAISTPGPANETDAVPGDGFGLPIDCKLGTNCWIVNYPDAGSESEFLDYECNHLTYDGHDGTDFAIRDLEAMRHGVRVVAAAAGEVLRVRDGVGDEGRAAAPAGRGCGNGVVVSHGDGWETQYCHLRDGSVAVRPGDRVARGDRLGLVGMSGNTEFPHVELLIRRNGATLDPFTGHEVYSGCGKAGRSLWHVDARPPYRASQVAAVGFATERVDMESLRRDAASPTVLSADAPKLVLWVITLGVEPGDRLTLRIVGPDGSTVFLQEKEMKRTQILRLDYGGRSVRGDGWTPGVYVGDVEPDAPRLAEKREADGPHQRHIAPGIQRAMNAACACSDSDPCGARCAPRFPSRECAAKHG